MRLPIALCSALVLCFAPLGCLPGEKASLDSLPEVSADAAPAGAGGDACCADDAAAKEGGGDCCDEGAAAGKACCAEGAADPANKPCHDAE